MCWPLRYSLISDYNLPHCWIYRQDGRAVLCLFSDALTSRFSRFRGNICGNESKKFEMWMKVYLYLRGYAFWGNNKPNERCICHSSVHFPRSNDKIQTITSNTHDAMPLKTQVRASAPALWLLCVCAWRKTIPTLEIFQLKLFPKIQCHRLAKCCDLHTFCVPDLRRCYQALRHVQPCRCRFRLLLSSPSVVAVCCFISIPFCRLWAQHSARK